MTKIALKSMIVVISSNIDYVYTYRIRIDEELYLISCIEGRYL